MIDITCIGVLAHPLRPQSFPIAERIGDGIKARGIDVWVFTEWEDADIVEHVKRASIVIAIGGDGAMLRASHVCAEANVPVLGINMGQLGFLTEIADPDTWEQKLDAVLNDAYWIEKRTMLQATAIRADKVLETTVALNDIVISGSTVGRMIQLEAYIDGDWATTYHADALVIASATGSTAYALACGGPILPPELPNMLIIPAAPHLSMSRPIVLSQGSKIDVMASDTNRGKIIFSADGSRIATLKVQDRVEIRVSELVSRFVRLRERNYFYRSILDRLEPRVQRIAPQGKRLNHDGMNNKKITNSV